MPGLDCHFIKRALEGSPDACGDAGLILESSDELFWALIDVLGHGRDAHAVAVRAEGYLVENYRQSLAEVMKGLHEHLRGTRGAVAALGCLHKETGKMLFSGIGNIMTRLYGAKPHQFLSRDGIIGYVIPNPVEHEVELNSGDILVATSDGIREHFDMNFFPDLLKGSARQIAAKIMDQLSKGDDDASCIVVRYRK